MPETAVGGRVGGLLLEEKLGEGGFGVVYRGRPDVGPARAVKILRDPTVVDALRREATSLLELRHSNVVDLIQADLSGDPPHLVMEYVEGPSLAKRFPLQAPEARLVCEGILDGLAAAHAKGIAHLDLKPANVLLGPDGPKLADFGLAHAVAEAAEDLEHSVGQSGSRGTSGTLAYMAPEQREGKPGDLRSDIYAFGVLLCQVLTGNLPQPGDTLEELLEDQPPAWATTLFERCYCRYEKRFANASEALEALRAAPREDTREGGTMFCGECGSENPQGNKFCSGCGHQFGQSGRVEVATSTAPLPKMTCPYCREEITEGAIKCRHCGERLDKAVPLAARTSGGATCAVHPAKHSAGACVGCGNFFCDACLSPIRRKNYCPDCMAELLEERAQAVAKSEAAVERERDRSASGRQGNIVVTTNAGSGVATGESAPLRRRCPFCHEPIALRAVHCKHCGENVNPKAAPGPSKAACILLAFFLPFGIHRFVMGYAGTGLLQMFLALIYVGILWSWVDGILIATDSLRTADGRRLS